ncbi:sensor histidine kinase [Vibrio sp.]|uniref:sensor histidine kinase n=1 Tax=Vibrio sp. TaxID=678 RepID=UPI003D0A3361
MIKWIRSLRLIHQIGIVVLLGLAVSLFLSAHLLSSEKSRSLNLLSSTGAIQRVLSVVDILRQTPASLHESIVAASSSSDLSLYVSTTPQVTRGQGSPQELSVLYNRLQSAGIKDANLSLVKQARPMMNMRDMHNAMMSRQQGGGLHMGYVATIEGSVQLGDNQWLNFSSGIEEEITHWSAGVLTALTVVMLATLAVSIFIIHRALAPVKVLGEAAREFALNRKVTPVSERCPSDLLPTITAFNKMQVDLAEYIQERTRLLAAISHDLRTPLTSLRLRLEFIEDSEDKQQMLKSVAVMEQMLKATMSFAKDDSSLEARQATSIHSLLQTIVDEYADKGIAVQYQGDGDLVETVPAIAVRRMLENLINNSVQYGGEQCDISLSVAKCDGFLEFAVADTGIGIDEAKLDEVIKPFTRLDQARDTAGSNVGLGLSITKALANNYGGTLTLKKNSPSGLVCQFTIALV